MKNVIKRIVVGLTLVTVITLSGLVTLVFFPQNLFAFSMEYKQFRVYANYEIDEELKVILDNSYKLIELSELHDHDFEFRIFLSHDNILNKIDDLQGKGPIARATAGNIIIKVPIDIKNNRMLDSTSHIDLTQILTHEMVHNLQANKYGLFNFSPLKHPPLWKLEGYPEYISRQTMLKEDTYDLKSETQRYVQLAKESKGGLLEVTDGHHMPGYYYKGRLMVEYLMDEKGWKYDEILTDTRTEDSIFKEILEWVN